MKKIITLLVLVVIMFYASSAASHYLDGTWLATPTIASLYLLISFHFILIGLSFLNYLKGVDKSEK